MIHNQQKTRAWEFMQKKKNDLYLRRWKEFLQGFKNYLEVL